VKITAIKTPLVEANDDIFEIIKSSIKEIPEKSVIVIASKIFSTCENRFVEKTTGTRTEKHELIRQEADLYLEPHSSKYDLMLTVKRNMVFVNAGLDESNSNNKYLLWPKDPQKSINEVWEFLRKEYGVKEVGVTMSDSSSFMLGWGVIGRAIVHCGFKPLKSYIGTKDLFGKEMKMEQTNIMQSLTDAAVLEMGEGNEQTPIAIVEDIRSIKFQNQTPTPKELAELKIEIEDDAYAPILQNVKWLKK
jgi:dihydrofolate synthase / folylpolyglutamate synthase